MHDDFFDIQTEPIIDLRAFYGEPKHIAEKCLIIFSEQIQQYLLDSFECEKIGEIMLCNGNVPVYCLTYKGEKIAFYLSCMGSTLASSICYESHFITGAEKYIMFGSCGSLDGEKTTGKFIVPTETYRGDGCSYYYAPASDFITVRNSGTVASFFESAGIPFVQGRVWTTDSVLRETKGLVAKRKSDGCIAVEMELAGVQAVCDFYGLQLFDFLESGDVLDESEYKVEGLTEANHSVWKAMIALDLATCI